MKRYKKLLVLLFSKKINKTFDFSSMGENSITTQTKKNYPVWLDIRTLDNVEYNSSQKILKEKMDKLIGYYLKTITIQPHH